MAKPNERDDSFGHSLGARKLSSESRWFTHLDGSSSHVLAVPRRFRLLEVLGRGSMGVVRRAIDCELGGEVAVKSLAAPRPDDLYRLKREFRLLCDIRHPNVVRVHELFVDECRGSFTMELVIGSSLGEFVHRAGGCDYARLRSLAKQLATAIAAVHAHGFLHRDVKSTNVIVTSTGRVVLLDFGLAAPLVPGRDKTKGAGVLVGTRGYISPEQMRGESLARSADWFSFGVMLFEAITGRRPFDDPFRTFLGAQGIDVPTHVRAQVSDAPADLDQLIAALLDPVARRRPGYDDIIDVLGGPRRATQSRPTPRAPHELPVRRAPQTTDTVGETTDLAQALDRVQRGRSVLLRLYGPRGTGKTATVARFLREAEKVGALVLRGKARPVETIDFNALDEVVDDLSHALEHMPHAELVSMLPVDVSALPQLFPILGRLEAATDGLFCRSPEPEGDTLRRARQAFKRLLCAIGKRRPLVVWIDDAHWADRESGELLKELLDPAFAVPVLLVLSYRHEDGATGHAFESLNDLDTLEHFDVALADDEPPTSACA
jgi:eukaryotic-like serine/threonine-protein kinase